MNFDYDEECGAAPGVMGHLSCTNSNCSCCSSSIEAIDSLLKAGAKKYASSSWQAQPKVAPPDSAWVKYAFIKRQTEKAILFAFNDKNGLSEQWVPKSVITGLQADPNRVKISQWFITRSSLNV